MHPHVELDEAAEVLSETPFPPKPHTAALKDYQALPRENHALDGKILKMANESIERPVEGTSH